MANTGKVALVTGGTNGLGLETSRALLQRGWKVFATSRNPLASLSGTDVVQLDTTDPRSVSSAVATVVEQAGRIDALVNNASAGLLIGAIEETPVEDAQAVFNTNLFGMMRMVDAVLPVMRKQGSGRIVNMSSAAGFLGFPFHASYCASYWAVEGFTESLRLEVAQHGISVSVVEPDAVAKDPAGTLHPVDTHLPVYQQERATTVERFAERRKRGVAPVEVGRAVAWVLEQPHPKLRYRVGKGVKQVRLLKTFTPESLFERALRSQFGISPASGPGGKMKGAGH
ncbi:MAG: SDR family NAD(P)-dependent oxidoreductase [Dehalococcoidia bacterium]